MIGIIPYLNDLLVTKYRDEFEERLLNELKLSLKKMQENKRPDNLLFLLINCILFLRIKKEFLNQTTDFESAKEISEMAETFRKNNLVEEGPILKKVKKDDSKR